MPPDFLSDKQGSQVGAAKRGRRQKDYSSRRKALLFQPSEQNLPKE
jgi:hypothetical protein